MKSDFNNSVRTCAICKKPMMNSWHSRKVKKNLPDGTDYLGDEYIHKHCEENNSEEKT